MILIRVVRYIMLLRNANKIQSHNLTHSPFRYLATSFSLASHVYNFVKRNNGLRFLVKGGGRNMFLNFQRTAQYPFHVFSK